MQAIDEVLRQQPHLAKSVLARRLFHAAFAVTTLAFIPPGLASAQGPQRWPTVRSGEHGVLALTVQRLLIHRGFDLVADANFGPGTAAAVEAFQQQRGLAADGIVGEDTWKELVVNLAQGPGRSAATEALQELLASSFGYKVAVDGVFGPDTAAAVVDFQALLGLQVDGIVGLGTWKAILSPDTVAALAEYEPSQTQVTPTCQQIVAWKDLVEFYPLPDVLKSLRQNALTLQPLTEARGERLNLDFYGVRLDSLPIIDGTRATPESLLVYVRRNWSAFYDHNIALFTPYVNGDNRFSQVDPLGAVIHIDMLMGLGVGGLNNPDDGTVVVSEASKSSWRFSTVWSLNDGYHPVSGTREFGIQGNADGSYTVYTRGADRPTTWIDDMLSSVIFSKADELWRSFQRSVASFVNENGGTSTIEAASFSQYAWEEVRSCFASN